MKLSKLLTLVASTAILSTGIALAPNTVEANAAVDVYTTPGQHNVNGRLWKTKCEKYSSTVERCNTDIFASQVKKVNGKYEDTRGWVFNNLTYKPSNRNAWKGNPLSYNTSWTSKDNRKWKTECDTAKTGRNGCRSYILSTVPSLNKNGDVQFKSQWVFNNMVRFFSTVSSGSQTSAQLSWPVSNYRLSSQFGPRIHPITKKKGFHTGLDMAVPCGRTVSASFGGTVTKAGWNNAYGNRVEIKHNSITTTYSHMSSLKVKAGQKVNRGSTIGYVGTTGLSTGCHMHFEVVKDNLYVNPWSYLTGKPNPTNATHPYSNPRISPLGASPQARSGNVSTMSETSDESDAFVETDDEVFEEEYISENAIVDENDEYAFDIDNDLSMDEVENLEENFVLQEAANE